MHYEVEQKFRVNDLQPVKARLVLLEARIGEQLTQVDCYYAHPQRDFSQTDEAFRLRSIGEHNFITYKGPKIDTTTKSRVEQEARLADGEATLRSCDEIVRHLGFEPVAVVRKQRQQFAVSRQDSSIEVALDDVEQLGQFVELEIGVDVAEADTREVDAAREMLGELAKELELSEVERRSYLELLLEKQA